MHPYRTREAPDAAQEVRAPRDRVIPLMLLAIAFPKVAITLATGEPFGVEATIALVIAALATRALF